MRSSFTSSSYRAAVSRLGDKRKKVNNGDSTGIITGSLVERYSMERRQVLLAVGGGVISVLTGCIDTANNDELDGDGENSNESGEETNETSGNESNSGDYANTDGGAAHSFEGSDDELSDEFELQKGITTIELSHTGEGDFVPKMVALEGEEWLEESLANQSGSVNGRSVIATSDGTYQLDVEADGEWSINMEQPAVSEDDAEHPPIGGSGTGMDYFGPIALNGEHEVAMSHDGEQTIRLQAHSTNGEWKNIASEIDEPEWSSTFQSNELVYFKVETDGSWTVSVR